MDHRSKSQSCLQPCLQPCLILLLVGSPGGTSDLVHPLALSGTAEGVITNMQLCPAHSYPAVLLPPVRTLPALGSPLFSNSSPAPWHGAGTPWYSKGVWSYSPSQPTLKLFAPMAKIVPHHTSRALKNTIPLIIAKVNWTTHWAKNHNKNWQIPGKRKGHWHLIPLLPLLLTGQLLCRWGNRQWTKIHDGKLNNLVARLWLDLCQRFIWEHHL